MPGYDNYSIKISIFHSFIFNIFNFFFLTLIIFYYLLICFVFVLSFIGLQCICFQNEYYPDIDDQKQKWMKVMEFEFESVHGQKRMLEHVIYSDKFLFFQVPGYDFMRSKYLIFIYSYSVHFIFFLFYFHRILLFINLLFRILLFICLQCVVCYSFEPYFVLSLLVFFLFVFCDLV